MNHKSGWWLFAKKSLYSTYTPVAQHDDPTAQQKHFQQSLEQQFSDSDSEDNENINIGEMKHGVADIATMEESYEVRF